jgi:hypothetical protein
MGGTPTRITGGALGPDLMVRLRGLGEVSVAARLAIGQGPALKINACSRLPAICRGRGTWSRITAVMWSQPELRRGRTFGAARARMMHTLYGRVQLLRSGKSTLTACISRSTARSTQIQMPPTWCGSAVFRRSSPARPPWSTEAAGEKTLIDPGMAASDSNLGRCPGRVEPPCRTMG